MTIDESDALTFASCQASTNSLSHPHSSTGQGEKNKMKNHFGQDKDREIAHQLLSRAKQPRLGGDYFNLLTNEN